MNDVVELHMPRTAAVNRKLFCRVRFADYGYRNGVWHREVVSPEEVGRNQETPLAIEFLSDHDRLAWGKALSSPPASCSVEVKLNGCTELLRLVWCPNSSLLPVGVTPVSWPAAKFDLACVHLWRIHRGARHRMLAMQEMLLGLLLATPGIACVGNPASVPNGVVSAVNSLKDQLQDITKKPRDYECVDRRIVVGDIEKLWSDISRSLRATGNGPAAAVADMFDRVQPAFRAVV